MSHLYYLGTFPRQVDKETYGKVSLAGSIAMARIYEEGDLKMVTSKLVEQIFEEFDAKIGGKSKERKYFGLSGHDSNMYPVLVGLGLASSECLIECFRSRMLKKGTESFTMRDFDENICQNEKSKNCLGVPGFASNFILELHSQNENESEKKYYIRALLNGKTVDFCPSELIDGLYCPYTEIKDLFYSKFVLTDKEF